MVALTEPAPFGLYGNFAGDDAKLAETMALKEKIERKVVPPVAEFAQVLEDLPFAGRIEFVNTVVMTAPQRGDIVRLLFDACFQDSTAVQDGSSSDIEDFVLIGAETSRCVAPEKYYILKILVLLLPRCGQLGVELFREYTKTISTAFRNSLLSAMVDSPDFSDKMLYDAYVECPQVSRNSILRSCLGSRADRRAFLASLVNVKSPADTLAPIRTLFNTSSETVAQHMPTLYNLVGPLQKWRLHGNVYIAYLQKLLDATKNHKLNVTNVLRKFEQKLESKLDPAQAAKVVGFYVEYEPLLISPSERRPHVTRYLTELSEKGTLTASYDSVERAEPCSLLLRSLDHAAFLEQHTVATSATSSSMAFDACVSSMCTQILTQPSKKLAGVVESMALKTFRAVEFDVFLAWITSSPLKRHGGAAADRGDPVATLKAVSDAVWTVRLRNRQFLDVFDAWLDMLKRHSEHLPPAARPALLERLRAPLIACMQTTARKAHLRLQSCSIRRDMTGVTSYIGFYTVLLEKLGDVLDLVGGGDPAWVLKTFELTLAPLSWRKKPNCPAIDKMNAKLEHVITQRGIPALNSVLVFDPSAKNYLEFPQPQFDTYLRCLGLHDRPVLLRQILETLETTYNASLLSGTASTMGFVPIEYEKDGQKRFRLASVKASEHGACQARNATAVWDVLVHLFEHHPGTTKKEQEQAWKLFKKITAATGNLDGVLMTKAPKLPPHILEGEVPRLTALALKAIENKAEFTRAMAASLSESGILLPILDQAVTEKKLTDVQRLNWLYAVVKVDNPDVRKHLEEQTRGSDMHERMKGHVALLTKSLEVADLADITNSLKYVAVRIKNEAGLTRPEVYNWIQRSIDAIVQRCLTGRAKADVYTQIQSALETMLRDDASKKDTVAKRTFQVIANTIVNTVVKCPCLSDKDFAKPDSPKKASEKGGFAELKQQCLAWLVSATRMQFVITKNILGESDWQQFHWKLEASPATKQNWVTEDELEVTVKNVVDKHCWDGAFASLRSWAYEQNIPNAGNPQVLPPALLVDLLLESHKVVKTEFFAQNKGCTFLNDHELALTANDPQKPGKLVRLITLLKYLGARWAEAPALVDIVKRSLANVRASPADHRLLNYTIEIVNTLHAELGAARKAGTPLWPALGVMREALETVVNARLKSNLHNTDNSSLVERWLTVQTEAGKVPLEEELGSRLAAFVVHGFRYCKLREYPPASMAATRWKLNTTCSAAQRLLLSTASAIFLPFVQKALLGTRDDLLLAYSNVPMKDLQGPFSPGPTATTPDTWSVPISPEQILSCNSKTLRKWTDQHYRNLLQRSLNAMQRQVALSSFVQSPATTHEDLVTLLETLTKDNQNDDTCHQLFEAAVLAVPSTDSAWYVLAHLLSPAVIQRSQARTTASILSAMLTWAHVDKVVGVIGVLLRATRRSAFGLFVHKSIVRMLFEAKTKEAVDLLVAEWENKEIHKDVRLEMAKLALAEAVAKDQLPALAEASWTMLEDIANGGVPTDVTAFSLVLFSVHPSYDFVHRSPAYNLSIPASISSNLPKPTDSAHARTLEFAALAPPASSASIPCSDSAAPRFLQLFTTLSATSTEPLKMLAYLKSLSFSPALRLPHDSIDTSLLDDITSRLADMSFQTLPGGLQPVESYYWTKLSLFYADVVLQHLTVRVHRSAVAEVSRINGTAFHTLATTDTAAQHLIQFLKSLHAKLQSTPLQDKDTFMQTCIVMRCIYSTILRTPQWRRELLDIPFNSATGALNQLWALLQPIAKVEVAD